MTTNENRGLSFADPTLFFVQSIIESHNGQVEVKTEPEVSFTIILPTQPA
jgi:signal transduction histidine kinase